MSRLINSVETIDDGSGIHMEAHEAQCECSNVSPEENPVRSDMFYVFWDPRFNPPHLHIQCIDCEQSYCPFMQCEPPPTAEVIGQR